MFQSARLQLHDFTLSTPAENLAGDEALLNVCEANGGAALRFWESPVPFVVVGYGNEIAREVNELATLVLGTHRAEDIEGTSQTYDVPCLALRDWLDETQSVDGGSLEATPSSLLASSLQYAALVRFDDRLPTGDAGTDQMLRRLVAIGGADIIPH